MQCFTSGFLSHDHLFSADGASQTLNVSPKTALTVSSVVRDLRSYPLLCSVEGCHPVGTIRYYLTVNSQDYVFVWPGQSAIYRSEEHTSELQSLTNLVCRLLLEK